MVFDPGYSCTFAQPVPQNVIDLVKAKIVEALAWAEGVTPSTLEGFHQWNLARPTEATCPCLTVYRRRTSGIKREAAQNYLFGSSAEFAVEIGVQGAKAGDVMRELETRVKAVDAIIRSATADEILAGFPEHLKGFVDWDVTEHVYGADVPEGDTHTRAAALTLTVQLLEG